MAYLLRRMGVLPHPVRRLGDRRGRRRGPHRAGRRQLRAEAGLQGQLGSARDDAQGICDPTLDDLPQPITVQGVEMREICIFVVLALLDAWLIRFFVSVGYPAIKTGIYPARGRVYLKAMHPISFWLCVAFFPALALVFAGLILLQIYVWFRG
ncbi:hypothetical protein MPLA_230039 [Mesorhizobium sp. ORS 3359]|nr:hypothetical protein MPLA_230039 [Mesorhizobium sp. ORS 3359]